MSVYRGLIVVLSVTAAFVAIVLGSSGSMGVLMALDTLAVAMFGIGMSAVLLSIKDKLTALRWAATGA